MGLPWCLSWQRIHLQSGRPGFNPWVGKIPWRWEKQSIPVILPAEFHGLYSLWGSKESDTTEQLSERELNTFTLRKNKSTFQLIK